MGEIRVKSENLFDVTTVTDVYLDGQGVEHSSAVSKTSDYIPVTANTIYTLGMTGSSSSLNITSYCFYDSSKELLSSGTYQPSTIGNIVSITTPNNCAYFRFTYNQQRTLVEFVSGVYNTFPPYFLNRPAHRYTNGQWVDIPTHHYTNGRWQGELTSQSPLKFWADGEMLDWRIEGKTNPEPETIVYGIHIDPNIQDPSNAVTYLEDAVGMTPASMGSTSFNAGSWADAFFTPKPCMVRYDGTVDYYLDPADYSKKMDGTASDIADPNYAGNAMMEWGLIWFKFEPGETDGEGYFYVSNKRVDDSFNCWCNYDVNNNINPHFYTAIYNGTGVDKLRSLSGVQLTPANGSGNTTGQQEITRAMANNTSELTEWYIDLWADRILVTGLLYLMGKSLNLQATFGRGLDSGGQTAKEAYVTGTLNDKGLFWGTTANGNSAVKVFGMENHWGCCYHRTAGLFGTADGYAYKLTHGNIDGSIATEFNTTPDDYIPVVATQPESSYVTKMSFGKYGMLPSATGGSTSTYYSDYFFKGTGFSLVGGNSGHGPGCGFSVSLNFGVGGANWSVSTSLSLKPRAKTPYEPYGGVGDWDETEQKYVIPVTVNGATTTLYTDHQLMDGDSIDFATDQTTILITQGDNTLTVGTAVQPSKVFIKFEG